MIGITIFLEYYIDGECRNNFLLKREAEMKYNIKKKRKTSKDMVAVIWHGCSSHQLQESWTCLSNVRIESREKLFFSTSGSKLHVRVKIVRVGTEDVLKQQFDDWTSVFVKCVLQPYGLNRRDQLSIIVIHILISFSFFSCCTSFSPLPFKRSPSIFKQQKTFSVFAYPDINTRGAGRIRDANPRRSRGFA